MSSDRADGFVNQLAHLDDALWQRRVALAAADRVDVAHLVHDDVRALPADREHLAVTADRHAQHLVAIAPKPDLCLLALGGDVPGG